MINHHVTELGGLWPSTISPKPVPHNFIVLTVLGCYVNCYVVADLKLVSMLLTSQRVQIEFWPWARSPSEAGGD